MILKQIREFNRTFEEAIALLAVSDEEAQLVHADVQKALEEGTEY